MTEDPRATVLGWLARNPGIFACVDEGGRATLFERATGKSLAFAWGEMTAAREAQNRVAGGTYVQLAFADGRALALAAPGFAFAPSIVSSGARPGLPETVCFQDFQRVFAHVEHAAAEGGHDAEALEGILFCIAVLDGARAAGFEVGDEERALERALKQVEARRQV